MALPLHAQQAERTYVCEVEKVCEASKECTPSLKKFELVFDGARGAVTAPIRGSVRLSEVEWTAIAPYWLVKQETLGSVEMLYFGLDENFVHFAAEYAGIAFRFSDEAANRGGPVPMGNAETTTMTGRCS